MSADYERKLHRAVAQFVKEADKKYPNWSERNDNGEWEIGLDKFDDMYKVILEIIEYTSCVRLRSKCLMISCLELQEIMNAVVL